jgi:hypothetical protein
MSSRPGVRRAGAEEEKKSYRYFGGTLTKFPHRAGGIAGLECVEKQDYSFRS